MSVVLRLAEGDGALLRTTRYFMHKLALHVAALRRVCVALQAPRPAEEIAELRIYFLRRAAHERGDDSFITGDINKIVAEWHGARARFAGPVYQDLYAR